MTMAFQGVATVMVLGLGLVFGVGLFAYQFFNTARESAHGCGANDRTNTYVYVPSSKEEEAPRRRRRLSKKEEECIICTDPLTSERSGTLDCGHYFHYRCIKQWLDVNKTCPICREFIK